MAATEPNSYAWPQADCCNHNDSRKVVHAFAVAQFRQLRTAAEDGDFPSSDKVRDRRLMLAKSGISSVPPRRPSSGRVAAQDRRG